MRMISAQPTRSANVGKGKEKENRASQTKSHTAESDDPDKGETAEAELGMLMCLSVITLFINISHTERLKRDWNAATYAFFEPTPSITYIDGCRVHVFKCLAKSCKGKGRHPRLVNRYLDTKDAGSTSNLRKHAKLCWSEETLRAADVTKDSEGARKILQKSDNLRDSQITATFERLAKGHGKVTYSHRQHTKTETKYALFLAVFSFN